MHTCHRAIRSGETVKSDLTHSAESQHAAPFEKLKDAAHCQSIFGESAGLKVRRNRFETMHMQKVVTICIQPEIPKATEHIIPSAVEVLSDKRTELNLHTPP